MNRETFKNYFTVDTYVINSKILTPEDIVAEI